MKRIAFVVFALLLLQVVNAQQTPDCSKESRHLATMVANCSDGTLTDAKSLRSVNALVSLTVSCDAPAFFERHGCRLIDRVGRIYIVDVPLARVGELSQNDTVERVEAERMPRPAMEVTPQQVNATGIYAGDNLPQAFTGEGVVAGVIVLWLQAKPDLTPAEALEAIRETATHPDNTLAYPNNTYGYGQIDAYRGLLYVLDLPSRIPDLSQEQPQGVQFRVENRMLYVDFGDEHPKRITLNVYALDGRLLLTRNGRNHINLSALKDGVYAVQVVTDQRKTTGSTLIRL